MLELKIVEHCAPTLAGLKTANLFNYPYTDWESFQKDLSTCNEKLNGKDVYIEVMKSSDTHALLYVYRKTRLEKDLKRDGVMDLLRAHGYSDCSVVVCLEQLKKRIRESACFPHEIGVFLSYPLEDVLGFIEHKGKNCKCCGVWKVYCDEYNAMKAFAQYRKCTEIYQRVFARGRSIQQMTVAA